MDSLIQIDIFLFRFVNATISNPVLDVLMPFLTNKYNWFPFLLLLVIWLIWKGGRTGRTIVLLMIPVIFLSDQLSASFIKPLVGRMRPCVALEDVNALIGIKRSFSFPSSHAANVFAATTLFAFFYPNRKYWLWALAAIIAMSRVYVGVHYPADVFFGALLGVACAAIVYYVYDFFAKKKLKLTPK